MSPFSCYGGSDMEVLGQCLSAILSYEQAGTDAGKADLQQFLGSHGITSLVRAMPNGHTQGLEYLIKRFSIRETQQ